MADEISLGRLMLIGIEGTTLRDTTRRQLDAIRPGAIVLFSRNIEDAEQIRRLLEEIDAFLGYAPLAAVDQEGGRVTRLRDGFTVVPDARAVAEGGGPEAARKTGEIIGREMASVGLEWTFAPVVDVLTNADNPGVGLRSYGESVDTVVACAQAFLTGLRATGTEGCLKHFPGLGRVAVDPHHTLPTILADPGSLAATELVPYRRIAAQAWMPTHVAVPALDPSGTPATLSKPILTGLARDELGFTGVLVADDLMMGGITTGYSLADALSTSLAAGMDMLTLCHEPDEQIAAFRVFRDRVSRDEALQTRAAASLDRVRAFRASIPTRGSPAGGTPPEPDPVIRGAHDDEAAMIRLSRAAIRVQPALAGGIPVPEIIYAPRARGYSPAADPTSGVPAVAARLAEQLGVPLVPYQADEDAVAAGDAATVATSSPGDSAASGAPQAVRTALLVTENAHVSVAMRSRVEALAQELRSAGVSLTVLILGTPYDRSIPGCEEGICTYGSSRPQATAILKRMAELMEAEQ